MDDMKTVQQMNLKFVSDLIPELYQKRLNREEEKRKKAYGEL